MSESVAGLAPYHSGEEQSCFSVGPRRHGLRKLPATCPRQRYKIFTEAKQGAVYAHTGGPSLHCEQVDLQGSRSGPVPCPTDCLEGFYDPTGRVWVKWSIGNPEQKDVENDSQETRHDLGQASCPGVLLDKLITVLLLHPEGANTGFHLRITPDSVLCREHLQPQHTCGVKVEGAHGAFSVAFRP